MVESNTSCIEIQEIMKILPHRYPFLLIDRIVEFEKGRMARGIKNVTINEPFFQGHFPSHPVMPGVLIIEAMAQLGGVLAFKSLELHNSLVYFVGINSARFRSPVFPGDTLEIVCEVKKMRGTIWTFTSNAFVGEKRVAEAEIMATKVER